MARLTVRLDDPTADQFATLAAGHGGKAALMRRLVSLALSQWQAGTSAPEPKTPVTDRSRLVVNLGAKDATRLQALAHEQGMRPSQWLRAIAVERLTEGGSKEPVPDDLEEGASVVRVTARLRPAEGRAVRRAAEARGMLVGQWLRALIRVRLGKGTQYSVSEQLALRGLAAEVSRVGVNLNQLVRAVNEARKMGKPLPADPAAIEQAKATVERTLGALEGMARGNVRYWESRD